MSDTDLKDESFEDFKNSFFYGTRGDLNFKFLKDLTNAEAADFIQTLFSKIGASFNDGQYERVATHVINGQTQAYHQDPAFVYEEGPFTPLKKPLPESTLTLVTSSGHFVDGDDPRPFGVDAMTQQEAVVRIADFLKLIFDSLFFLFL